MPAASAAAVDHGATFNHQACNFHLAEETGTARHVGMACGVGPGQLLHANPELQQLLFLFLFCERAKHKKIIRGGFDYTGFKRQAQARIEDSRAAVAAGGHVRCGR